VSATCWSAGVARLLTIATVWPIARPASIPTPARDCGCRCWGPAIDPSQVVVAGQRELGEPRTRWQRGPRRRHHRGAGKLARLRGDLADGATGQDRLAGAFGAGKWTNVCNKWVSRQKTRAQVSLSNADNSPSPQILTGAGTQPVLRRMLPGSCPPRSRPSEGAGSAAHRRDHRPPPRS
jgi:hypothetical protein